MVSADDLVVVAHHTLPLLDEITIGRSRFRRHAAAALRPYHSARAKGGRWTLTQRQARKGAVTPPGWNNGSQRTGRPRASGDRKHRRRGKAAAVHRGHGDEHRTRTYRWVGWVFERRAGERWLRTCSACGVKYSGSQSERPAGSGGGFLLGFVSKLRLGPVWPSEKGRPVGGSGRTTRRRVMFWACSK